MNIRYIIGALLVSVFIVGSPPLPLSHTHSRLGALIAPTAEAQKLREKARSLLDRVLGKDMPDGIVKTNGRIEATQVDVAAKYPGRLADITVEEGSEVKAGQVVGRVSSPEYEAQLRAAQSNVEKAKQSLAEAESLITQRKAVLAAAKSDFERGKELIGKQVITQQTYDQRQRNYEGSEASVQGAIAQRDQAEAAIKNAQAEVERIEAILRDLVLISPRTGRVQYQLARNGEVVAAGGKVLTILDLQDVYMTIFLPAATAGKLEIGGERVDGAGCANRDIDHWKAFVLFDEAQPLWVSSHGSFVPPMSAPGSRPGLPCCLRLSGASRHMAQALLGELHAWKDFRNGL